MGKLAEAGIEPTAAEFCDSQQNHFVHKSKNRS